MQVGLVQDPLVLVVGNNAVAPLALVVGEPPLVVVVVALTKGVIGQEARKNAEAVSVVVAVEAAEVRTTSQTKLEAMRTCQ